MTFTPPLALYVHIPFCSAKCTYCDFNSYAGQDSLMAPYAEAVAQEAGLWAPHIGGRQFETVFFGGGTPSILPLPEMRTIVEGMRANLDIAAAAEFSLEANPGTVDAAHLQGLRDMGFNRISFGVQSFHEDELRSLDRIHDAQEVEDAYRWARIACFDNINLDLIYGLIGQGMQGWQSNLEKALALEPEHLSLYALTLEEGTPLTRDVARGRTEGPDLDLQADMFEWSRERMTLAGYHHYEVSNWSKPGRECRHNLVYWHNGDWLGLGAGAHSHLFNQRFADAASPSRYITLTTGNDPLDRQASNSVPVTEVSTRGASGDDIVAPYAVLLEARGVTDASALDDVRQFMPQVTFREAADLAREMSETVILALRLREGLNMAQFRRRFGVSFESVFGGPMRETLQLGLTEQVFGRLRLRDEAVMLGDEAFLRFLPDSDE
jgi:oxygen-independent coproporphyrinogen-3 oxidase